MFGFWAHDMELQGFPAMPWKLKHYGLDGGEPQWKSELLKWRKKKEDDED